MTTTKTDAQKQAEKAHAAHAANQKALADQPAGYLEPVFDEPQAPSGITHVLAARSITSLADLEGERIPAEDVHPNGQPVRPKILETVPDPFVAERDVRYAPLSKDAETTASSARKQRQAEAAK